MRNTIRGLRGWERDARGVKDSLTELLDFIRAERRRAFSTQVALAGHHRDLQPPPVVSQAPPAAPTVVPDAAEIEMARRVSSQVKHLAMTAEFAGLAGIPSVSAEIRETEELRDAILQEMGVTALQNGHDAPQECR